MTDLLLPTVLFLPLVGALFLMLVPAREEGMLRGTAFAVSLATFLVSLGLVFGFDADKAGFQFVTDKRWVDSIGARFKIGVDGISVWLVLLTTFLTPIVLLSAWRSIEKKVKEFVITFLILETGMLGAFVAIDLFLFYIAWEVMLIPMYFIIGVWGGDRRVYASIKFVLYTMVGSLLMLVAIFYLYVKYGQALKAAGLPEESTFDLEAMWRLQLPHTDQIWCFLAFSLAFAIKVPVFPLHTWLPDAHVEAPTSGSVILAGVLLKFGVYGFLRFAIPLFPYATQTLGPYMFILGMVGVVYGALMSYAQDDIKKLIAYSSVSHLGFCVMGAFALNPAGMQGAIYAALSHGFTTSGLFLAVGVLYDRRHTRRIVDYGGITSEMPFFSAMFLICTLGSVGLPALSGFVGEFLTLIGSYVGGRDFADYMATPQLYTVVATSGVILSAVYLLTLFQKVMLGPLKNPKNKGLPDLSPREKAVFLPIVLGIFVLGVAPMPFLKPMAKPVDALLQSYRTKLAAPDALQIVGGAPKKPEPKAAAPEGTPE
ncbi:MAG TPA: NADH-quinone oxidoreductase subunit M [Haliangiales bacterium]|nr:NADH-quinone oxidoreductase subunit M [Haliangiales bacterium]